MKDLQKEYLEMYISYCRTNINDRNTHDVVVKYLICGRLHSYCMYICE